MSGDLSARIFDLLRRKNGARLSLREIAAELKLPVGDTGEPHQNLCRLGAELARAIDRDQVNYAFPNHERPEFNYWIEPPKRDFQTGELRP